jgi:hypothetical protein
VGLKAARNSTTLVKDTGPHYIIGKYHGPSSYLVVKEGRSKAIIEGGQVGEKWKRTG